MGYNIGHAVVLASLASRDNVDGAAYTLALLLIAEVEIEDRRLMNTTET
jgi:hypothetical protein